MSRNGKQNFLFSLIFALVAISAASLAGVVYLARGGGSAPAAALPSPTASPIASLQAAVTKSPAAAISALATSSTTSAVTRPVTDPSRATLPIATPSLNPVVTAWPAPSPTPTPIAAATSSPPPKQTAEPKISENTMSINTLIGRMADRPFDSYGNIGIVKRGSIAYYTWAQELYQHNGKDTKRILSNVDCDWMYVDGNNNLWFGIKSGIGIDGNKVQQWDSAYRYDSAKGSFMLMRQESRQLRFVDGHGFMMYGPYYLYIEGSLLMACHTGTGEEIRIDSVCSDADIRVMEEYKAVYYQNAKREYMLLSDLGEPNQRMTALNMAKFPDGQFRCEQFATDQNGLLYRFRRTGYERLGKLVGLPAGAGQAMPSAPSDGGIGFPGIDTVTLNYYDVKSKAWLRSGSSAQEGSFSQATADGCYWFVNWKPSSLFQIYQGKYAKYDLSGAMASCTWAGIAGDMVFLSEYDFYSKFTHVFFPESKTLYEITFPPLPGDLKDH